MRLITRSQNNPVKKMDIQSFLGFPKLFSGQLFGSRADFPKLFSGLVLGAA